MGDDVGSILLGMGYGVLGGGNIMSISRLGRSLYYLVTGSRILLFRVWIQGGLLAVLAGRWSDVLLSAFPCERTISPSGNSVVSGVQSAPGLGLQ